MMGFTLHPSQDRASARRIVRCEHLAKALFGRRRAAEAEAINCPRRVVLDMDSTEIPVYGEDERALTADGVTSRTVLPALRTPNSDSGLRY